MASDKRVTSITMPETLVERADEVAKEQDRSRSSLIRCAVRFYCDRHEERKEGPQGKAQSGPSETALALRR